MLGYFTGRDPMVAILENYVRSFEEDDEFQAIGAVSSKEAGFAEEVAY